MYFRSFLLLGFASRYTAECTDPDKIEVEFAQVMMADCEAKDVIKNGKS